MNEAEIRKIFQDAISAQKADKSKMTHSLAEKLSSEVIAKAKAIGVKAVVCVSDAGGAQDSALPAYGKVYFETKM